MGACLRQEFQQQEYTLPTRIHAFAAVHTFVTPYAAAFSCVGAVTCHASTAHGSVAFAFRSLIDNEDVAPPPPVSTSASPASPPGRRASIAENTALQSTTASTSRNLMDDAAAVINVHGEYRRMAAALNINQSLPPHSFPRPPPRLPLCPRPRLPTGSLSDEEAWWIVLEGERPGVYQGR